MFKYSEALQKREAGLQNPTPSTPTLPSTIQTSKGNLLMKFAREPVVGSNRVRDEGGDSIGDDEVVIMWARVMITLMTRQVGLEGLRDDS